MSEPDLAPQKMKLSQKFRHLMRCKKYLEKNFLSCLVSEIQLFVYIFGWISKWPPEVRKGLLVKFFEVSYYQKNFQLSTVHKSEDRGGIKMPYDFFVYICDYKSTNSWLGKKTTGSPHITLFLFFLKSSVKWNSCKVKHSIFSTQIIFF